MLFIGRKGPLSKLSRWLVEDPPPADSALRVGTIFGPGGMGKTFLLEFCLQNTPQLEDKHYLKVRLDGQKAIDSLEHLLAEELAQLGRQALQDEGAFARLRRIGQEVSGIMQKTQALLAKSYRDTPALEELLSLLLSFGLRPQRALAVRPYDLRLSSTPPDELERAIQAIQKLKPFAMESQWLKSRAGREKRGKGLRNALRRDLETTLADALIEDLTQAMSRIKVPKTFGRTANKPQLLLVLDDYESMEHLIGDFLVEHLVTRLQHAPFQTFLLVLGRDNLLATHTAWGQHHRKLIDDRLIELKPFERQEAFELMRRRGIHSSEIWERIWDNTQGFPFLLDLECEDELAGGTSALGLKLFFDRLTRWMTPIQRAWIVPLSFLHEINLETVEQMLPEHEPQAVLDWFKVEASVRDPHASRWQVIPFVRTRIQQYIRNDSPHLFRTLKERAKEIQALDEAASP